MVATATQRPSGGRIVDRIKVIDVDTHLFEPYDVFTSRVSKKWGDLVPRVVRYQGESMPGTFRLDPGDDVWVINDQMTRLHTPVGSVGMAGWHSPLPSHPPTINEVDPAGWDPKKRLERMDEFGIYAQVLYPNIMAFHQDDLVSMDPELGRECVRAYNDFLYEWCSTDPKRLIPLAAIAVWDRDWTMRELERCAKLGFRGVVATAIPETLGQPFAADPFWEPYWSLIEDLQLSVNFHTGVGGMAGAMRPAQYAENGTNTNFAKGFANGPYGGYPLLEMMSSGIAQRHPNLNFVSVETGAGWIPYALQYLEWTWDNFGVWQEHPDWTLRPTELFKRQMYGTFWWENQTLKATVNILGSENFMFESDFPHPTGIAPGRGGSERIAADHLEAIFGDMPEEHTRNLLHNNAVRVYRLED